MWGEILNNELFLPYLLIFFTVFFLFLFVIVKQNLSQVSALKSCLNLCFEFPGCNMDDEVFSVRKAVGKNDVDL